MSVLLDYLTSETTVKVFEGLHHIDDAVIETVEEGRNWAFQKKVRLRSLLLHPGQSNEMIFISDNKMPSGWYLVYPGLFDEPCFNLRGPVYALEPK